ncbi:MAG TPA: AAC(3) family N-acetyltransferase [Thermoanaerobaculia bacterium]|nr:AAC(3) family N-acetyltransferase [Thermoanaerobaculia bacterium]
MPHARGALSAALRELGLQPGAIVMVHASVRAVGEVHGGPDEIHLAVADAVNPGGTVMMFVGCQDGFDDVGRGIYTPEEEAEILEHQPPFDSRAARASRDFGILAELFRSFPGTVCSGSVCGRMAARGARARWLTANQPWNYGFGPGSPLEKLCKAGGSVLLLGSDHDQVTVLHYAEHVADFAEKRIARYQVPVLREGERVWVECEEFDTGGSGVHPHWPDRFFALIVDDFIARRQGTASCSRGMVGGAASVRMDAARLVEHALPIMEEQARGNRQLDSGPLAAPRAPPAARRES